MIASSSVPPRSLRREGAALPRCKGRVEGCTEKRASFFLRRPSFRWPRRPRRRSLFYYCCAGIIVPLERKECRALQRASERAGLAHPSRSIIRRSLMKKLAPGKDPISTPRLSSPLLQYVLCSRQRLISRGKKAARCKQVYRRCLLNLIFRLQMLSFARLRHGSHLHRHCTVHMPLSLKGFVSIELRSVKIAV